MAVEQDENSADGKRSLRESRKPNKFVPDADQVS